MKRSVQAFAPLFAAVAFFGLHNSSMAADSKLSAKDEKFVIKAAQGGTTEVQLGALAKSNAAREDVKKFGEMMVTDHAKANANLTKVATAKGVKLPDKLDKKHAMMVDKMTKLSGKEFDTAYVSEMVEDHKKDVAEFEKAANELSDPDLKAFAKETLPTLKKHLEKIEQIRDAKK